MNRSFDDDRRLCSVLARGPALWKGVVDPAAWSDIRSRIDYADERWATVTANLYGDTSIVVYSTVEFSIVEGPVLKVADTQREAERLMDLLQRLPGATVEACDRWVDVLAEAAAMPGGGMLLPPSHLGEQ